MVICVLMWKSIKSFMVFPICVCARVIPVVCWLLSKRQVSFWGAPLVVTTVWVRGEKAVLDE